MPFVRFRSPENMRGAGRRQALVRKRRTPWPASRQGRSSDRRRSPAHDAGRRASRRPAAALAIAFRPSSVRATLVPGDLAPISQLLAEAVVPPGGAPTPPGCRLRADSAGAAPASEARNCRAPAAGLQDLFSGPPPACSATKTPHRVAPLGEQGARQDKRGFQSGDYFFRGSYPRDRATPSPLPPARHEW